MGTAVLKGNDGCGRRWRNRTSDGLSNAIAFCLGFDGGVDKGFPVLVLFGVRRSARIGNCEAISQICRLAGVKLVEVED
jgi:hypothetical protein